MVNLSKKYTRYVFYLFTMFIPIWLIITYVFEDPIMPLRNWSATKYSIDIWESSPSAIRQLLDNLNLKEFLGNETIVINMGKKRCIYLGKSFQICRIKSQLLSDVPLHTTITRQTINKDLLNSRPFYWFGYAEYLFYDVITLIALIKYHTSLPVGESSKLVGITQIFHEKSENLQNIGGLYANITSLDINTMRKSNFLSDITVLFGEDAIDPRHDWVLDKSKPLTNYTYPSYISIKYTGSKSQTNNDIRLKLNSQHKFKIVQLADLHFSVGVGICEDEFPAHSYCEADSKTLEFIEHVLDIEKPELVIFTGDQIMGGRCKQDSESAILKALAPVIKRKIPYGIVWGNHDDEGSLDRWQLSELVQVLPYSLFKIGPNDTPNNEFGVGNYAHQVFSNDNKPRISLYFLDSHKYSTRLKHFSEYDWIKEAQWKYIENIYYNNVQKYKQSTPAGYLSMAFFHIPLPEYRNFQSRKNSWQTNPWVGSVKEGITAPLYNSNGMKTLELLGVSAVSVGHDHCNDYCLLDDSLLSDYRVWLCYGGGTGEGGYGGYGGTERRVRIFEIDGLNNNIHTWKRLHHSPDETFDYQTIVSNGIPNVV